MTGFPLRGHRFFKHLLQARAFQPNPVGSILSRVEIIRFTRCVHVDACLLWRTGCRLPPATRSPRPLLVSVHSPRVSCVTHTHVHTQMHACIQCMHTHTHMHTYTHAHMCTYNTDVSKAQVSLGLLHVLPGQVSLRLRTPEIELCLGD